MIEVQEGDEVPLTLTEVFGNRAILTDDLVHVLDTGLGTNAEALETRIPQNLIDAVDSGLGIRIVFIQG